MKAKASIIGTFSKTVHQPCYYDGYGFTMLKSNAKVYPAYKWAKEAKPLIEELFNHHCFIEYI